MDRAVTTMETFSPVSLRGSVFPFVVSCADAVRFPGSHASSAPYPCHAKAHPGTWKELVTP